jgi:imidazolonepropionase-like amidohydrolase
VDEANKLGKTTMAHCEAYDSVGNAARAGVNVLEHCGFILPDGTRGYDKDAVKTMVENHLYYNPTLQTGSQLLGALKKKKSIGKALIVEEIQTHDRLEYKIKRKSENLMKMVEMGVQVVAGSDEIGLGNSTRLIQTLELMVDAGMTPIQVIASATSMAAKALRMDHLFGTVRTGLAADIISVSGDPSKDISCLKLPSMVMQSGKIKHQQAY